jgi:hypothetical protein
MRFWGSRALFRMQCHEGLLKRPSSQFQTRHGFGATTLIVQEWHHEWILWNWWLRGGRHSLFVQRVRARVHDSLSPCITSRHALRSAAGLPVNDGAGGCSYAGEISLHW